MSDEARIGPLVGPSGPEEEGLPNPVGPQPPLPSPNHQSSERRLILPTMLIIGCLAAIFLPVVYFLSSPQRDRLDASSNLRMLFASYNQLTRHDFDRDAQSAGKCTVQLDQILSGKRVKQFHVTYPGGKRSPKPYSIRCLVLTEDNRQQLLTFGMVYNICTSATATTGAKPAEFVGGKWKYDTDEVFTRVKW